MVCSAGMPGIVWPHIWGRGAAVCPVMAEAWVMEGARAAGKHWFPDAPDARDAKVPTG